MFDRIFSAALAFCMLAGGTLAVGTAMLEQPRHEQQIVHLQPVQVIGKRPTSSWRRPMPKPAHACSDHAVITSAGTRARSCG
jgi:hypothetical protein